MSRFTFTPEIAPWSFDVIIFTIVMIWIVGWVEALAYGAVLSVFARGWCK